MKKVDCVSEHGFTDNSRRRRLLDGTARKDKSINNLSTTLMSEMCSRSICIEF